MDGDHSESVGAAQAHDRSFRIEAWPAADKASAVAACGQLLSLGGLGITAWYTWAGLSARLSTVGAFDLPAGSSLAGPLSELASRGLAREVGPDRWQLLPCEPCLTAGHEKRSTVSHYQRLAAEARRIASKRRSPTGLSMHRRRVAS